MLTHWLEVFSGVRESTLRLYFTHIFTAQMGEPKEGTDILGQWFIFFVPQLLLVPTCIDILIQDFVG